MRVRRVRYRDLIVVSTVVLAVVLSASLAGCATAGAGPSYVPTAAPSQSAYSASFHKESQSFSVPAHEVPTGEYVVRPDFVAFNFAVRADGADAAKATLALGRAVAELERRVKEATGGAGKLRLCGFRVAHEGDVERAYADGAVETPLAPSDDYWARARLWGALAAMAKSFEPPKEDGSKALDKADNEAREAKEAKDAPPKDAFVYGFSAPQVMVRDVEKHRTELARRWAERVRAFTAAAETAAAPLHVAHCDPPLSITQRTISLEEVALNLPVTCRVESLRAK